jgi:hypothetical protein
MNTLILRARRMSLALLVVAVIDHGQSQVDYSGATPRSSGLMRLGRDLMRNAGGTSSRVQDCADNSFINLSLSATATGIRKPALPCSLSRKNSA